MEAKMKDKFPTPWSVYTDKLRPSFALKIIEIHDAHGNCVMPWGGFDCMECSYTQKLKLARRIVKAVNAA